MEIKKWMQDSLYKTGLNFGDTVKAINDILGKLRDEEDSSWSFEFGIGLDYSDSYGHQWDTVHLGRGDTLDISAPMLGYYLSGYADSPWYILPDVNLYFGGTAGFYSTQNATATTPKMGSFAINGNTFALEGLVGGSWPFAKRGASSFFVEVGYHYLKTTYASTDPKTYPIKRPGPVSLDLSGFHLSVGIEFAKKSD
ncbi:MAG TPA: hypothetical protein VKS81_05795 [Bacteroidota bacterium]|nr:hypothetical protein [Bacteroidota bacterium]